VLEPTTDMTDVRWVLFDEVENCDLAESVRSFFRKHRKELEKKMLCAMNRTFILNNTLSFPMHLVIKNRLFLICTLNS